MTATAQLNINFGASTMAPPKHSIFNRWTFWVNRMLLRRLLSLNDKVLNDMGLTREDVAWACELPICRDAAVHMRKRADARLNAMCRGAAK